MSPSYRYTIMKNEIGAEERSYCKTCKEAVESCPDDEIILRDSTIISSPSTIPCYEYDILDLQEALKYAGKDLQKLRWHIKAFVDAYKGGIGYHGVPNISPSTKEKLEAMCSYFGKTEDEIISTLIEPYFMNLSRYL